MVESANKLVVEARLKGGGDALGRAQVNPMVGPADGGLRRSVGGGVAADHGRTAADGRRGRRPRRLARRAAGRPVRRPAAAGAGPVRGAARLEATLPTSRHEPAATAPAGGPTRPKLVVDGRPTRQHPWKRPFRPPALPVTPCPAKL